MLADTEDGDVHAPIAPPGGELENEDIPDIQMVADGETPPSALEVREPPVVPAADFPIPGGAAEDDPPPLAGEELRREPPGDRLKPLDLNIFPFDNGETLVLATVSRKKLVLIRHREKTY